MCGRSSIPALPCLEQCRSLKQLIPTMEGGGGKTPNHSKRGHGTFFSCTKLRGRRSIFNSINSITTWGWKRTVSHLSCLSGPPAHPKQ